MLGSTGLWIRETIWLIKRDCTIRGDNTGFGLQGNPIFNEYILNHKLALNHYCAIFHTSLSPLTALSLNKSRAFCALSSAVFPSTMRNLFGLTIPCSTNAGMISGCSFSL